MIRDGAGPGRQLSPAHPRDRCRGLGRCGAPVETDKGHVETETLVIAAGIWSPIVGAWPACRFR